MYCVNCGSELQEGQAFCPNCGASQTPKERQSAGQVIKGVASASVDAVTERVTAAYGTQDQIDLKFRDFFSEITKSHSHEEAEKIFICGTSATTPKLEDVEKDWPKPWFYSRVFILFLATYLMTTFLFSLFGNARAIPSVIFVGSFVMPVTLLIFFFEANALRNISLLDTIRYFLLGGIGSILILYPLFTIFGTGGIGSFGPAMLTGFLEETAKVLIVAYLMSKRSERNYILNGLLIGAAVGCGFSAFENAGYAFDSFIDVWAALWGEEVSYASLMTFSFQQSLGSIIVRNITEIAGHGAWTAVAGAAIAIASNGEPFKWPDLAKKEFLTLFIIPIICHGIWDWQPFTANYPMLVYIEIAALTIFIWIVLLVLLRRGLSEVNHAVSGDLTEQNINPAH